MRRVSIGLLLACSLAGCAISTQQEVQMGADYAAQINRQLPIVRDAEVNRYVNLLGDSIARLADNRNLNWEFYIVDSREVNAFAVPGGFIYVNRGLIERTRNMSQLAGVLAHEIGHVVRRHSVQQMQAAQRANLGLTVACILTSVCESQVAGAVVQVGGAAVFARFSREDESEADAEAVRYVVRAGIHPAGIPEMFRILINERSRQPSALESWFRTHPLEENRVATTERAVAQISPSVLARLTRDTQRYQQFRSRVSSLPAVANRQR
ncbi:MAG: M48 family metallopeptidase [Gemmatimonadota bacterium]